MAISIGTPNGTSRLAGSAICMLTLRPLGGRDYEVATILALASMSAITAIAFLLEWHDVFAVLAAFTAIFIGLPVLSLASNFWFGEMPPQVHRYNHYDEDGRSVG